MNVLLKNIPAYCLSHYKDRRIPIADMCAKLGMGVSFIDSDTSKYSRQQNLAHDTIDLIYRAMCVDQYPFLVLEDDATLIDSIPHNIYVPEEIDLIYWGSSKWIIDPNKLAYLTNFNNSYYRIHNSLSGHSLLIPNYQSAKLYKNILIQSLITNKFSDVLLLEVSESQIFLTPKDGPYFYQNDGRNEGITNFKWKTSSIPIKS